MLTMNMMNLNGFSKTQCLEVDFAIDVWSETGKMPVLVVLSYKSRVDNTNRRLDLQGGKEDGLCIKDTSMIR